MKALFLKEFELQKIILKSNQGKLFMFMALLIPIITPGVTFLNYFISFWVIFNVISMFQMEVRDNINNLFLSFPCTRGELIGSKLIFSLLIIVEGIVVGGLINGFFIMTKIPLKSMVFSIIDVKIALLSAVIVVSLIILISMSIGYKYANIVSAIAIFIYTMSSIFDSYREWMISGVNFININSVSSNMLLFCSCGVMLILCYVLSTFIYSRKNL